MLPTLLKIGIIEKNLWLLVKFIANSGGSSEFSFVYKIKEVCSIEGTGWR